METCVERDVLNKFCFLHHLTFWTFLNLECDCNSFERSHIQHKTPWPNWLGVRLQSSDEDFHRDIRIFLVHSDTEYRPIEFLVSHLLQNLEHNWPSTPVAYRATTLFTIGWRPVHHFLLMSIPSLLQIMSKCTLGLTT